MNIYYLIINSLEVRLFSNKYGIINSLVSIGKWRSQVQSSGNSPRTTTHSRSSSTVKLSLMIPLAWLTCTTLPKLVSTMTELLDFLLERFKPRRPREASWPLFKLTSPTTESPKERRTPPAVSFTQDKNSEEDLTESERPSRTCHSNLRELEDLLLEDSPDSTPPTDHSSVLPPRRRKRNERQITRS